MKHFHLYLFILWLGLGACSKKQESTQPVVGNISESVYASGRVKAKGQYVVYATVNGILQGIRAQAGDSVRQGQVLFEIESDASGLNTENARLALELSQENSRKGSDRLRELELAVTTARDRLRLDSSLFARQQALWKQRVGTELELEQKQVAYQTSAANYQAARSRLAQARTQLNNERKRAQNNYSLSRKQQGDFEIKSELDGRVYDVLKEKGELITPQTPLAIVGRTGDFIIELEVDERDIARIAEGQTVIVTMDSYKGKTFEATVTRVFPIMNERSRTFTVEAHFKQAPTRLFPNLTLEANIVIHTHKNAITIPASYLVEGRYVWVSEDEKRAVKTGLRDYTKVEITEGLQAGQTIYKPQ